MVLLFNSAALGTKGKLLNCLPGMRWIPHDLPTQDPSSSSPSSAKPRRTLLPRALTRKPSEPDHGAPVRRKSTISITSMPDPELDVRTNLQGQSLFFARLPLEIRKMVYEYVFGEEVVHLTLGSKRRFGHFVCEEGGKDALECGCRVLVGGRESRRLEGASLALLKSCRRVYTEAVPHLYTPHNFSLLHLTHLLYLPSRVPAPRLKNIRTLRLRWTLRALPYLRRGPKGRVVYPEDTANWARGWSIIAGMEGLKDLYVVLIDPRDIWREKWLELEETLLEPIKSVTKPRWFELALPYSDCRLDWDMGESRVRLTKPEGDEEDEEKEE